MKKELSKSDIIMPDEIPESKQLANKNESLPTSQVNASFITAIHELMLRCDLDLDRMDKYLNMQERILNKQAETEFNIALSEMQPNLPIIKRHTQGQNNKYASHEDIMMGYRPILSQYGFSLSFSRDTIPEGIVVIGTLAHKGGHKNTVDLPLPLDTGGNKNQVQAVGSSIKYGMRYLIQMMLNVVTANDPDDDDGRAAGLTKQQATVTKQQAANISSLLTEVGADKTNFLAWLQFESIADIPANQYDRAINALEKKRS